MTFDMRREILHFKTLYSVMIAIEKFKGNVLWVMGKLFFDDIDTWS